MKLSCKVRKCVTETSKLSTVHMYYIRVFFKWIFILKLTQTVFRHHFMAST